MEALVPAFLLAVITQLGDRPAKLAAMLADRYGRPVTVAFAALLAHAAGNFAVAAAALAVAPMMTPEARTLLLAIALVLGGIGGIGPARLKHRYEEWKLGSLFTPLLTILILSFGERTQFFTFALAARGQPWFAAAGATIGAFAVAFVAAVLGELAWKQVNLLWLRIGSSLLLLGAGVWMGLAALRLL